MNKKIMEKFIGNIHDTRELTTEQIDKAKLKIKKMLNLDTVEIEKTNSEFYSVSTNDTNIVDFKLDNYNKDNLSLVKYSTYDDDMKRDKYGAILTSSDIKCKE